MSSPAVAATPIDTILEHVAKGMHKDATGNRWGKTDEDTRRLWRVRAGRKIAERYAQQQVAERIINRDAYRELHPRLIMLSAEKNWATDGTTAHAVTLTERYVAELRERAVRPTDAELAPANVALDRLFELARRAVAPLGTERVVADAATVRALITPPGLRGHRAVADLNNQVD